MSRSLIVADIGNSTIDIGRFCRNELADAADFEVVPPTSTMKVSLDNVDLDELCAWLPDPKECDWNIGSVNEPMRRQLLTFLSEFTETHCIHTVRHDELDMPSSVRNRNAVGIDRLAASMTANRLRRPHRPAIVLASGSAITFNVVSANGVFLGGMITSGLQLNLQSLFAKTDRLPNLDASSEIPSPIGDDTSSAMQAGVFWMTATGIDGVISLLERELAGPCDVFGTGGSIAYLLPHISHEVKHQPHLVISGLAMAKR